jgi:hypothetical protein
LAEEAERKAAEKREKKAAQKRNYHAAKREVKYVQWKQCQKYVEICEKGDMDDIACLGLIKELVAEYTVPTSQKGSGRGRVKHYIDMLDEGTVSLGVCLDLIKTYVSSHGYDWVVLRYELRGASSGVKSRPNT